MGKLFKRIFPLSFVLFIFMLTACSINKPKNNPLPEKMPSDFSFVLNYGVNAKNQLDTKKETYTLDTAIKPTVITNFKLSDDEINDIYTSMRSIDIFNYPDNFYPDNNLMQTPFYTYSIKIIANGKVKNIYWKDENVSESKDAVQLRDLFKKIHRIVAEKEEYKKMPPAQAYD